MSLYLLISFLGFLLGLLVIFFSQWLTGYLECQEKLFIKQVLDENQTLDSKNIFNKTEVQSLNKNNDLEISFSLRNFFNEALNYRFFLLPILSSILSLFIFYIFGSSIHFVIWLFFILILLVLAVIDLKIYLLPDLITLPLMWLGVVIQLTSSTQTVGLENSIYGIIFGYVPLWAISNIYFAIRSHDGLGGGDLKLFAAIGAWMGPLVLPVIVLLASIFVIMFHLFNFFMFKKISFNKQYPFGPWIIFATLLLFFKYL